MGPFLGMPPRISLCVLVPTAPREPLNSVRILPDPWWPFTTRVHCLASATPPGPPATPAAPRAGSARAGPMSSGGSVPAVRRASTGSRTANVSAYLGRPKSSLVQADEAHPGQGLSSFTVLETHLGICESADPESGGLGWGLRVYISRSHSEDSHATGPGTTF